MWKREFQFGNDRTVFIALFFALISLTALLSYVALNPPQEVKFVSIYTLDDDKMAINYPQLLVSGKNNTVSLWIGVKNFMGVTKHCSVLVKIPDRPIQSEPVPVEPVKSYDKVLLDREIWEFPMKMALNQTGSHRMIFELWLLDGSNGFIYSGSSSSIWVDVVEA